MGKGTTKPGYENTNRQRVLENTGLPGNDHNAIKYRLKCLDCGHEYGANGTDIWQRKCPAHDNGADGLPLP